jgi:septum formation protein
MAGPSSRRLVLASASTGRRELLEEAGYDFEVRVAPPGVEEAALEAARAAGASAGELALAAARAKAGAVAGQLPDGAGAVVLAADTLVLAADGTVLGKADDPAGSAAILRRLTGTLHRVISGAVLICPGAERRELVAVSEVRMAAMSAAQIEAYVRSGRSVGASGGYRIQREGTDPYLRVVGGGVSNVVGLPMEEIIPILSGWGVRPVRKARGPGS